MMTKTYFADFHIHVGISESGKWIKVPSSKNLTVKNILQTALYHKGLDIVGIIDALSPLVQQDLKNLLLEGSLCELKDGGYLYKDKLTVLVGGEVESKEEKGGLAHSLFYLPTVEQLADLTKELSFYIKNINMSSQNAHMDIKKLYNIAKKHQAKIIPAHIFTPFKSIYGNCTDKFSNLFNQDDIIDIAAVELGLSADSLMANQISELESFSYLANSDAHSLQNIAREFNELIISGSVSYKSIFDAIAGKKGKVKTLYGLNPAMGKYYLTRCAQCGKRQQYGDKKCLLCGGRVVRGVSERVKEIADRKEKFFLKEKAIYQYHFPLIEVPGIGNKMLEKVYDNKLTELYVMYKSSDCELEDIFGKRLANIIKNVKKGEIEIKSGGAGCYGKIVL